MARSPSRASSTRKLSKGGAINRASIKGNARGTRPTKSPNETRARSAGSGRRGHSDQPSRGRDPERPSQRPSRQVFGTVDATPAQSAARRGRRKSGANGGSRFEYDERDSTDSAEPTGWSGMDEERQKRPASREAETRGADWSRTNTKRIDNDYEETGSSPKHGGGRARADAADHAPPTHGDYASTEGHVTGAAARGRRWNRGVVPSAQRGRAGRPRNDW